MAVVLIVLLFVLSCLVDISHSDCTTTVTVTTSETYLHNVRVSANDQITCPSGYPIVYDGQCVSYKSSFNLIYSSPSNPSACSSLLPQTTDLAADDQQIRTAVGASWFYYSGGTRFTLSSTDTETVSEITLANGTVANVIIYYDNSGQNHFPIQLTSGSTTCNATYICESGSCLNDITDTSNNEWCGGWSEEFPDTADCSSSGRSKNTTCDEELKCTSVCSYDSTNSQVTCNLPCSSPIATCEEFSCPCFNGGIIVSAGNTVGVSLFLIVLSAIAILFS